MAMRARGGTEGRHGAVGSHHIPASLIARLAPRREAPRRGQGGSERNFVVQIAATGGCIPSAAATTAATT
ncbi:hypothetical protein, partial [Komagataeibacter sucrofermentans]|uniref:hypothetical protein n=1 Tax=Komagataeibacter sucrofermentans TaxID=1053551 RepID=UPI00222F90E1